MPSPAERIAEMTGCRNSSNFYKSFRRYYGASPKEKREQKV
ncbi:MAG: AraC family transcriptional regulator [Lachnospiraceae bacterium]